MKYRNGYVSNSSSSSFLVPKEPGGSINSIRLPREIWEAISRNHVEWNGERYDMSSSSEWWLTEMVSDCRDEFKELSDMKGSFAYLDGNDTVGNPENKLILDGETDIVLSKELFENGSLALEAPASTYAELVGSNGVPYLRETFGKTPMLWLWAKPGAEFVCIEPWSGSDERVPTENLENKKGILCLAPAQSFTLPVSITIL